MNRKTKTKRKPGVTAFFVSCNRYDLLKQTLSSFLEMNTYPLEELIVVEDGPENERLSKQLQNFTDVRIIFAGKCGQWHAVDVGMNEVQTQYAFAGEDDWEFLRPGFIEYSIRELQKNKTVIQAYLRQHPNIMHGENQINIMDTVWAGFSFNPHVFKMYIYDQIPGGYGKVTKYVNYSGGGERKIIDFFRSKCYKIKGLSLGEQNYIRHLGADRGLPRYPTKV